MNADLLLDNLAPIAAGPGGVARLRELILKLAVRGNLGTQHLMDEPVSMLLEEIRKEKGRLGKGGKLRKEISSKSLDGADLPFTIPKNWMWTSFGEVTFNRDGERIPIQKSERETRHGPYDYYGASGVIDSIDGYLFDKPLLLIGEDGANLINRSTSIAFIAHGKYWVNNHAHVLDGISITFLRYLEIYINSINLQPYITGMAQPKMNQAKMNSIPVPLPPLAEQHRIVQKVDRLMALCDDLESRQQAEREERHRLRTASLRALEEAATAEEAERAWAHVAGEFGRLVDTVEDAKEFRALLLQLMVKGVLSFSLPDNVQSNISDSATGFSSQWELSTFESIFQFIDYRGETPKKETSGIRLITAKNVRFGYINKLPEEFISPLTYQSWMTRGFPQTGDILITTEAPMGNVAVLTVDEPIALAQRVIDLHPKQEINTNFYQYLIMSRLVQNSITANSSGMTATGIKAARLKKIYLPIPSLAEQNRIVEKIDRLMAHCNGLEAGIRARDAALEAFAAAACRAVLEGSAPGAAPAGVRATGQQRLPV